jgi:hypothetical protein
MVSCSAEEFFSFSYGLVFCVKDFDLVGLKDRIVGRAELTQEQLLYMDGERVAVELDIPQEILDHPPNRINLGKDRIYSSKIYLRVRKATPGDKKFIMTFNDIRRSKREGVYCDTSYKANADWLCMLKRESKQIDGVEVVSTNEKLKNDLTARTNNCGEKILCHYTFTTRLTSMVYVSLSLSYLLLKTSIYI